LRGAEALRLLKQAGPAAGTAVKSLWKGVWGKPFFRKVSPSTGAAQEGGKTFADETRA